MANTIKPKRSNTSSNTPSLQEGEIAINVADKKLWIGDNAPTPTPVLIVDGNADCFGIASADISNWNTAYSWGDHASAGYSTGGASVLYVYTRTGTTTSVGIANGYFTVTLRGGGTVNVAVS